MLALAERINSIVSLFLATVTLTICLLAPQARAQSFDPLPPSDQTSYSAEEQQQIAAFVLKRVALIGGDDTEARETARSELLAPLRRAGVSVAFRRAVRSAGIDELSSLTDSSDEHIAINALFVLAEIADDASRLVVQRHTADESQAVRYAAIGALKRTFSVVNTFSPAIDPGRVSEMVAHLNTLLTDETDATVADAITLALLQASQILRDGFETPAMQAIIGVASRVGPRLRAAEDSDRPLALISCVRVAEALTGTLQSPGAVKPEIARAAAGFGGEMLGHLAFLANDGSLPEDRRWELDLARLSERCVVFARSKLGGNLSEPGLATMLERGENSKFFQETQQEVLSLSGDPTNLPTEVMQRIKDTLEDQ